VHDRPRGDDRFDLNDLAYLQAVASHIGGALELSWAIRAARQAARRASAMVKGSPLPLALVTRAGRVLEVNPAMAQLFGLDSDERARNQSLDAFPMILDRATSFEALDLAASGVPWRGRARVLRPGEGERQCEAFFTLLGDEEADGQFLLAIHDRTDELRARQDVVAREKLATVGTLAAGVAHEVNNPLAAIRMEAELLGLQHQAPEIAAASQAIIREVDRAARIAKSLLRLATHAHGRMETIDLGQILADVVAVRAPLLGEVGIALRLFGTDDLPRVLARGGDLEQILLHVLTNAEDAVQGQKRQEIEIRAMRVAGGVRFTVDDTGSGVPADLRTKIFDPFYTTKPPDKASGLGLAMCQRIVSELGGRLWAEESPLGGARFVVELPGESRAGGGGGGGWGGGGWGGGGGGGLGEVWAPTRHAAVRSGRAERPRYGARASLHRGRLLRGCAGILAPRPWDHWLRFSDGPRQRCGVRLASSQGVSHVDGAPSDPGHVARAGSLQPALVPPQVGVGQRRRPRLHPRPAAPRG
jgi:signal transduction histidine kinase